mmetsp:Transcript_11208/g.16999  ORF Transcript_11208/g.16999 Transcript_11208/m.16999 type:complete len:90 (+) Transcript_11208:1098-1367(+)
MHSPAVFPSMLKGKEEPSVEVSEPKMPKLLRKIFKEEKTRVEQIVFNQDKTRCALLQATVVVETEIIFYELMDELLANPPDEKAAKIID